MHNAFKIEISWPRTGVADQYNDIETEILLSLMYTTH